MITVMAANDDQRDRLLELSGLEFLRFVTAIPSDERPAVIGDLFKFRIDSIEEGTVVFSLPAEPEFANPLGTLHGGTCATLLDSVMGCAVHSTLEAGVGYGTLELKVNYVRTVPVDGRRLTATGTVIHTGRTVATAEGRVVDENGKLVAHATTTCMIYR